jgi:hypothetical protein
VIHTERELVPDAVRSGVDRGDKERRVFPQTRINIGVVGCSDEQGPDVRIRRLLLLNRPFGPVAAG